MSIISMAVKFIHYFTANNASREEVHADSTETHGLCASLVDRGYDPTKVVLAYKMTDKDCLAAIAERQAEWDRLKLNKESITGYRKNDKGDQEKVILSGPDMLSAWQAIYTVKGKLVKPTHCGVTGYHRNHTLPIANAIRAMGESGLIETLPVLVRTFKNQSEIDTACIEENTLGTLQGVNKLSPGDLMVSAHNLFQSGSSEAQFRRLFKTGTGQKLFAICQLNSTFPKAGIKKKILAKEITYGRLEKETVRKAVKEIDSFTDKTIVDHITAKKVNDKSVMAKPSIKRIHDQNECLVVKMVCKAILDNDTAHLKPIIANCEALNAIMEKVNS